MTNFTITIPDDQLCGLDHVRGEQSRADYLQTVVASAVQSWCQAARAAEEAALLARYRAANEAEKAAAIEALPVPEVPAEG